MTTNRGGALRVSKIIYFCYYSAAASLTFLVVYYRDIGLSSSQIGFLAGILPLVMFFSAPLWGALGDITRQVRSLLLAGMGGALIFVFILPFVKGYTLLIFVVSIYAFFIAPVMPMIDNTVLGLLGENKGRYGKIRLWGAIGWGLTAPIVGYLSERYGSRWVFNAYLLLMLLNLVISTRLPVIRRGTSPRFEGMIRKLLSDWQWVLFLGFVAVGGISLSIVGNFLFLYMGDIGADKTLMGVALMFATLSELPVLFFSEPLLKRFQSRGLLIFSLGIFAIRVLIYSLIKTPWLVLPVQLLHGPTFSGMWLAGVSYASEIAPEGMGGTAQGLFSGVLLGLGGTLGAFLGGFFYDRIGPAWLFRLVAVGIVFTLLVFGILSRKSLQAKTKLISL